MTCHKGSCNGGTGVQKGQEEEGGKSRGDGDGFKVSGPTVVEEVFQRRKKKESRSP